MAPRKRQSGGRQGSRTRNVAAAIKRGRAQGAAVVAFRATQRERRARAIAARPARARAMALPNIPASTLRALGPAVSVGLLIAEGDSWFDYPFHDVLRLLEDDHGYDVESVAHKGDTVENMAYSGGQFEEFARRLEKTLRDGRVPDAVLISGGGNDIAGEEFAILLNHAASGLPAINDDVVKGVIEVRLRDAYAFLIGGLTEIAHQYIKRPIPIVIHGYDYPIPDGRGFLGGFGPLPGPWLQPGFRKKGHGDLGKNIKVMKALIDAFNNMLEGIRSTSQFQHVHHLDLRGTLADDTAYKKDWANELHPTEKGFAAVAEKFATLISRL
jgi:lysophospholipase L1-like esterase